MLFLRYTLLAASAALLTLLTACQSTPPSPASALAQGQPLVAASGADAAEPVEGDPAAGKQLFVSRGCVACHRAPGVSGAVGTAGPNLAGFASRPKIAAVIDHTPANTKRWLMNPAAMKPGTAMPNLGLSDQDATNLTAFLETLK